ncbi:MAG: hypothetical protein HAW61_01345 [Candidatus Portiera sp.]|nr:hypothetical protein [Portiera sp.]
MKITEMKITEIGQIESKQRRFKKSERSIYERMLILAATPILIMLLASCSSSGGSSSGGTNPGPLRGEVNNPLNPSSYYDPIDSDGNGFLELWHPAHLLSLTASYNNTSLSLSGSYELIADINLAEYSNWQPIGNITHPFTGKFDGRDFSITNISSTEYDYAGLFGVTNGASLSNLKIKKVDMLGETHAGALAGFISSTNISNIEVDLGMGQVRVASSSIEGIQYFAAGGLVGYSESSNLDDIRMLGTGSVRSYGKVDAPDNRYNSGGLVGLSVRSNFINSALDAQLDIIAGNAYRANSAVVGGLIGRMRYSSVLGIDMNFTGQLLAQSFDAYNTAAGLVGYLTASAIHGVTANINSSIVASPIPYDDFQKRGIVVSSGVIGEARNPSSLADITVHISGNIIADNNYNDDYAYVGGILGAGSLESIYNTHLSIDGDLVAIGYYNTISGVGSNVGNLANLSVEFNGNWMTEVSDLNPVDTGSLITGMLESPSSGRITNVFIVINGNISSESSVDDNEFNMMLHNIRRRSSVSITDSYVLINGLVKMSAPSGSNIRFGGFAENTREGHLSIHNSYTRITGGVKINATSSVGSPNTLDIGYIFSTKADGLIANITDSYFAMDAPLAIYVDDVLSPEYFGGAVGLNNLDSTKDNLSTQNTYYHLDLKIDPSLLMQPLPNHTPEYRNYVQLRCPTSAGEVCGDIGDTGATGATSNLPTYLGWNSSKWDFGTETDLPKLRRDIYFDSSSGNISDFSSSGISGDNSSVNSGANSSAGAKPIDIKGGQTNSSKPTKPLAYYAPADSDGNGFLELWHPAHLLSLTDSYNNTSLSLSGSYELIADINLAEYSNWQPIGNLTHPFTGKFDGRGFSITNISSIEYDYAGLFGVTNGASLSNLKIKKVDVLGELQAGALAGFIESTNISNIEVDLGMGQVIVAACLCDEDIDFAAGGLVGYSKSSNLDDIRMLGAGSVRSYGKENATDNYYYSGGLVGVSKRSSYTNSKLAVQFDIIAGNAYKAVEVRVGGLIGDMSRSSITNADVDFTGRILAQGFDAYNIVGGLVGASSASAIHGVTANINSSIIANSIKYNGINSDDASAGGILGISYKSSKISNIILDLLGDIIAGEPTNDAYAGGLLAEGDLHSAQNVQLSIDGDIIVIGKDNAISTIGPISDVLTNVSILVNGDLLSKIGNYEGRYSNSYVGVMLSNSPQGGASNVSVVINGNIFSESRGDNNVGMMVDYHRRGLAVIKNSYVLVNGSVDILGLPGSEIKFGGFISGGRTGNLLLENTYVHITGGVRINATSSAESPSTLDLGYIFGTKADELIANITNSYFAIDDTLSIYVNDVLSPEYFGGAVGLNNLDSTKDNLSTQNTYYHLDLKTDPSLLMQPLPNHTPEYRNYVQLRCPTSAGDICGNIGDTGDTGATSNLPTYLGWNSSKWDFGTATDLPKLRR